MATGKAHQANEVSIVPTRDKYGNLFELRLSGSEEMRERFLSAFTITLQPLDPGIQTLESELVQAGLSELAVNAVLADLILQRYLQREREAELAALPARVKELNLCGQTIQSVLDDIRQQQQVVEMADLAEAEVVFSVAVTVVEVVSEEPAMLHFSATDLSLSSSHDYYFTDYGTATVSCKPEFGSPQLSLSEETFEGNWRVRAGPGSSCSAGSTTTGTWRARVSGAPGTSYSLSGDLNGAGKLS
jgi:hypothetical protein